MLNAQINTSDIYDEIRDALNNEEFNEAFDLAAAKNPEYENPLLTELMAEAFLSYPGMDVLLFYNQKEEIRDNFDDFNVLEALIKARTLDPMNAKISYWLGVYYNYISKYEGNIFDNDSVQAMKRYFEEAWEGGYYDEYSAAALGKYYESTGKYIDAKQLYTRALELDSLSPSTHLAISRCMINLSENKEAVERIHTAINLAGEDNILLEAYSMLAELYRVRGPHSADSTFHYFEKCLNIDSGHPAANLYMTEHFLGKGEPGTAFVYSEKLIFKDEPDPVLAENIFMIYEMNGHSQWLSEKTADLLKSEIPDIHKGLLNFLLGQQAQMKGNTGDAKSYFTKAKNLLEDKLPEGHMLMLMIETIMNVPPER